MRSQITKRININLTEKEQAALENLTEEYANRNWKANTSNIFLFADYFWFYFILRHLFAVVYYRVSDDV